MRKTFKFRVADMVFNVIQHDMTEKKAGVTIAIPVRYKEKDMPEKISDSCIGKTVCSKEDVFNELTGIKQACFKALQKVFSIGISDFQRKLEQIKAQQEHCKDALESKIGRLYTEKTKKNMEKN